MEGEILKYLIIIAVVMGARLKNERMWGRTKLKTRQFFLPLWFGLGFLMVIFYVSHTYSVWSGSSSTEPKSNLSTLGGGISERTMENNPEDPEAHVFYHIMLFDDMERTWSVVNEQIGYLRSSGMENIVKKIHYTSIGNSSKEFQLEPEDKRYEKTNASNDEGWEPDTLHLLHSHCKRRPQDVVLYIHTKGVYHNTDENEVQRQDQTMSLSEMACLQSMREKNEVGGIWDAIGGDKKFSLNIGGDACGMRFSPHPHAHFPGNMWWARCSYIQNLIDPIDFEAKMDEVSTSYTNPWFKEVPSALGIGRFSAEHWVASHPSIRVLDVMPAGAGKDKKFFIAGYDLLPTKSGLWKPQPSLVPRNDVNMREYIITGWFHVMLDHGVYSDMRIKEYGILYGEGALDQSNDTYCHSLPCRLFTRMEKEMEIVLQEGKISSPEMVEHYKRWIAGLTMVQPGLMCPESCRA